MKNYLNDITASCDFKSSIKINGFPILAPLMTAEKRKEMRKYKMQAIKLEMRLARVKKLREYIETLSLENDIHEDPTALKEELSKEVKSILTSKMKQNENNIQEISTENQAKLAKLTCDIEVTQYISSSTESEAQTYESDKELLDPSPKRLIRSESYTLITPSPLLIQHMQNLQQIEQLHELRKVRDSSTEPQEEEQHTLDIFDTSVTEIELKDLSDNETTVYISDNEVKKLDDVNPTPSQHSSKEKGAEQNITIDLTELKDILNNIPEEYSKKIIKLLDDKKSVCNSDSIDNNDITKVRSITSVSTEFFDIQYNPEKFSTPYSVHNDASEKTIYFTMTSDSFVDNTSPPRSITDDISTKLPMSEEHAACIICAVVKGYLVRRLIQTTKVQSLIQTIKDALICAVCLHHENMEDIDESDVALHRRLIQQISAACYAFHDLFFKATTKERMSIIRADREKKKEMQLKNSINSSANKSSSRPVSARSRSSTSVITI